MMDDNKISFSYDPDTHLTTCRRAVHNKIYIGTSKCHPDDYDFENKLTGQHYAYTRSMLKEMSDIRDEYRSQLKILKHLYNIYEQNPNIDMKSNECYYVRRQMQVLERDLKGMSDLIKEVRNDLHSTIIEKDKLYAKIRKQRSSDSIHE